jgi:large conductance mechanosensitive channel
MLKEFKKFAMRGNVIDLAVGVIVGGAFNKIVTSLVNDIISPLVGLLLGGINLSEITVPVIGTSVDIKAGLFLQTVIDFMIIAFSVFMMVKGINALRRKQDKEEKIEKIEIIEISPTKEELLLAEIRDILRDKNN